MFKKLIRFIRFWLIFIAWTAFFMAASSYFFKLVWKFDLFNKKYWRIISSFWDNGGVINTGQEVLFIICLLLLIPLWFFGLKKALKIPLVKIFFFPFFLYNAYQEKKYSKAPKSIVIKNMGMSFTKKSPRQAMEEMIASRMPKETDKKDLNSSKIRSNLEEKNIDFHKRNSDQS